MPLAKRRSERAISVRRPGHTNRSSEVRLAGQIPRPLLRRHQRLMSLRLLRLKVKSQSVSREPVRGIIATAASISVDARSRSASQTRSHGATAHAAGATHEDSICFCGQNPCGLFVCGHWRSVLHRRNLTALPILGLGSGGRHSRPGYACRRRQMVR